MACYNGGSEGAPTVGASQTGYYLKKYVMEDVSLSPTEQSKIHTWVLFRYAEIVLNYAEATNKVLGPDGTDAELGVSARTALNQIRTRALMPAIPASVTSKEAFQEALMREKRVEFALEGHRFWDVRRWKVANLTQEKIYGVNIVLDGDTKTYTRVEIEDRTWNDKKYLFPIPARELYNNSNLYPQNPGW